MNKKARKQQRLPGRAQIRAQEWIDRQERQSLDFSPDKSQGVQPRLGTIAVKRALLRTTEGGIFDRADIMDFLHGVTGAKVMRFFEVSLIIPAEGRQLIDPWGDSFNDIKQNLEATCRTLPDTVSGYAGRAWIFGARSYQQGRRFLGYSFDPNTSQTLNEEREALFDSIGQDTPRHITPHVTLLETDDGQLARQLTNRLYEFRSVKIPMELGPAQAVPIPVKSSRGPTTG